MTKKHKETSKTIKNLAQNAKKGNLLSMFQLYDNYSSGKHVEEKDEVLAKKYFDDLSNELVNTKFKIKSIELYEFRRFRALDIDFNENLTVIIGSNGVGKTSIVDAMAKTFSWFNNNLDKSSNARPVTLADINVNSCDCSEITTILEFNKNSQFETCLTKTVPGHPGTKSSEVNDIKLAGLMYRHMAKRKDILIPLLAYYSVKRSNFKLAQSISEKITGDTSTNRFSALDEALDGTGNLEDFSELYIELVNLAEGESSVEVKKLREQIASYESLILDAYKDKEPPRDDVIVKAIETKRTELAEALKTNCSTKHQKQLELVNRAIESIVPDVSDFEVDRTSGKLKLMVSNFGCKVNISQLSEGQKTLVALTGDIARRLVTLNPDSDNPLNGHGIIVIDEIELHLHPKWQQEVLSGLQKVFSNIQFIVTTHSPQVLSHIGSKSTITGLRSIDGQVRKYPVQDTYGKNTDRIYEDNMNVSSRPKAIQDKLDEIFLMIEQKNLTEARCKIGELKDVIGEDGQLVKASTLIKRMEMIGR
ncbi:AAA family ATPase [Vibrio splendidus]|uniref:retron Ec78 anti-phage system effector ATPase PtuA n=1 Tax=Vibrio splendidus TaxID=29497 RepID=UPI003D10B104